MPEFNVHLESKPSPGRTFYSGTVDVVAFDAEDAVQRALDKLRRGPFPDRSSSAWRVKKVECLRP